MSYSVNKYSKKSRIRNDYFSAGICRRVSVESRFNIFEYRFLYLRKSFHKLFCGFSRKIFRIAVFFTFASVNKRKLYLFFQRRIYIDKKSVLEHPGSHFRKGFISEISGENQTSCLMNYIFYCFFIRKNFIVLFRKELAYIIVFRHFGGSVFYKIIHSGSPKNNYFVFQYIIS